MLAYKQAIKLAPKEADLHFSQAVALYELGRYQEAFAACEQALRLNPTFAAAHMLKVKIVSSR